MVPGYRHVPGNHCGSTALRNLLAFHGVEISEEMALGLGAGVSFYYVRSTAPRRRGSRTGGSAARGAVRRADRGADPARHLRDPEAAWEAARAAVDAGRPAILLTDLYYLDHYGSSAHFPGHAVVLAGYDAEVAYLSDTGVRGASDDAPRQPRPGPPRQASRLPPRGSHVHDPGGRRAGDVREASADAIARDAKQMLEPPLGEYEGLPALRRFAAEVGDWPEQVEDWQWCARFCYQVIERRGTGGGNFRLMYSRFLDEAGHERGARWPRRQRPSGRRWPTELLAASEAEEPQPELWSRVGAAAAEVLDAEERLWPRRSAAAPTDRRDAAQALKRAK